MCAVQRPNRIEALWFPKRVQFPRHAKRPLLEANLNRCFVEFSPLVNPYPAGDLEKAATLYTAFYHATKRRPLFGANIHSLDSLVFDPTTVNLRPTPVTRSYAAALRASRTIAEVQDRL